MGKEIIPMPTYKEIYDYGYDKNFLFKDKQLGQNVIINGKNAYDEFDADLIAVRLTPPSFDKSIYKSLGKHKYNINMFGIGNSLLELTFYVGGHTHMQSQLNTNKLVQEFIDNIVVIKLDESDFEYVCVIDDYKCEYTQVDFYYFVTITASAIKRLPIVKYDFGSNSFSSVEDVIITFENSGIINSGLDIVVRFSGGNSFTINCLTKTNRISEINFTDLSTSNYYYKIGGLDGVVYRSGNSNFNSPVNVFLNTDLVDFPIVKPGENSLEFIQQTAGQIKSASISFYPTFIV